MGLSVPESGVKTSGSRFESVASISTSCGRDGRLYFPVRVEKLCFQGLYDSGAACSVIGRKGWKRLENRVGELETSNSVVSVADGRTCEVLGTVRIPVVLMEWS